MRILPFIFLLKALAATTAGVASAIILAQFITAQALLFSAAILSSYLFTLLFKLPRPWQLFSVALIPSLAILLSYSLPALPLFVCLAAICLIYLPTFWTRVPYYPTHIEIYDRVLEVLPQNQPFRFIDLGCGFADLLSYLAERRPQGIFAGSEISILPYLRSKLRRVKENKLDIHLQSLWQIDLSSFDFVYVFLSPEPMPQIWQKAQREMKKGSLLLVNSFDIPGVQPERVIELVKEKRQRLYIYRL